MFKMKLEITIERQFNTFSQNIIIYFNLAQKWFWFYCAKYSQTKKNIDEWKHKS